MSGELSIIKENHENYEVSTQINVLEDGLKITMKSNDIEAQAIIDVDFEDLIRQMEVRNDE